MDAAIDETSAIHAIETIGSIGFLLLALMAVQILLIRFARPQTSAFLVGLYVLWLGIAGSLAWFAFHPAVRAMGLVSSPLMFAAIGCIVALVLFAMRSSRQDLYGLLEIGVGFGTLIILGREYDDQPDLTILIAFVGAVYVMVRGLTNIGDCWKKQRNA